MHFHILSFEGPDRYSPVTRFAGRCISIGIRGSWGCRPPETLPANPSSGGL